MPSVRISGRSITHRVFALLIFGSLVLAAGHCLGGQVGSLEGGEIVENGKYAYIVPPTAPEGDHEVVLTSAPRAQWIVQGGPYENAYECGHS